MKKKNNGFFEVKSKFNCSIYKKEGVEYYDLCFFDSKSHAISELKNKIKDLEFELMGTKKALNYFENLKK